MSDSRNLKPGWKVWRFDQIALNVTDRAEPTPDDSEFYVGLEHLDSDSLRVRRWGSKTDMVGTKFRMHKGDILFARRNAYLKRVAVAPHDGLFSAHGMILRPKSEAVLPELLPFFMQSDLFMNRAIEISVGSLSPTINWKTMAVQKFALPPADQQEKLLGVLVRFEECLESAESLSDSAEKLRHSLMIDHFEASHSEYRKVSDIGKWHSGGTPARGNTSFWGGQIPWVSPKDMKLSELDSAEETLTVEGVEAGSKLMPKDTIMIVVRGMILAHTFPVARTLVPAAFNQDMKALVVSEEYRPKYIQYWFEYAAPHYLRLVSQSSHGTKRLESDKLFSLAVPRVSLDEQDEFIRQVDGVRSAVSKANARRADALMMKRYFLNQNLAS